MREREEVCGEDEAAGIGNVGPSFRGRKILCVCVRERERKNKEEKEM